MARIVIVLALALAACGSDRYAAEREQVDNMMPDAEDVACSGEPRRAVDCEGTLNGIPMFCEFRYDKPVRGAYGGVSSCWAER